jgi:hypothetical protein
VDISQFISNPWALVWSWLVLTHATNSGNEQAFSSIPAELLDLLFGLVNPEPHANLLDVIV